jgi:uncharacterized protein with von Willebrand factor type A (vWA) domain
MSNTQENSTLGHDRFIQLGSVGDATARAQLVAALEAHLGSSGKVPLEVPPQLAELYGSAIQAITQQATLRELSGQDPTLRAELIREVCAWIESGVRHLRKTPLPHAAEAELLELMQIASPGDYKAVWVKAVPLLEKAYTKQQLDPNFYSQEFADSLEPRPQVPEGKSSPMSKDFMSVQQHLVERWEGLLQQKALQWRLAEIDALRKPFVEELYKRLAELKRLQEALAPIGQHLGRLWDLSKADFKRVNFDLLKQFAALLERDQALRDLAELLGRLQEAEKEMEEESFADIAIETVWRIDHAQKSELIGIRESDDLSAMLASESALLADPDLELLFFKRFAEKKLQTYDYQAKVMDEVEKEVERKRQKAQEKKGPILICVDTSGSMHGEPETVAKTMCFAMLKLALQEQRKCYLISFSTGIATLDLTDFQNSLARLLDFLGMSFHGGTDAGPAFQEALRKLEVEDFRKADVLMISDFIMPGLPAEMQARIAKAQAAGTRFHSLVIGSSQNQGALDNFDHNWHYEPGKRGSLGQVLHGLLGRDS